jgi:hypothetical protein
MPAVLITFMCYMNHKCTFLDMVVIIGILLYLNYRTGTILVIKKLTAVLLICEF